MNYYERALELKDETIANRRHIHKNAETGLDLPKTKAYVMEKLTEYGLEPKDCGYGVTATLGKGGKVLLLRADMDALPMPEESGEEFACPTGKEAHTCGHDFHAAMLLTAAKMLKEKEDTLEGTIKFMFQPAEETFEGSKNMIENGILENPPVDAALAYHVSPGKMPIGLFMYNDKDTMMYSVDGFKITIHGKGSHGAYPHVGVDPINIGVHIHLALLELIARESDPTHSCVLTIGQFAGGTAANIIPETAVLQGTIRTNKPEARELLVRRMKEVADAAVERDFLDIGVIGRCQAAIEIAMPVKYRALQRRRGFSRRDDMSHLRTDAGKSPQFRRQMPLRYGHSIHHRHKTPFSIIYWCWAAAEGLRRLFDDAWRISAAG